MSIEKQYIQRILNESKENFRQEEENAYEQKKDLEINKLRDAMEDNFVELEIRVTVSEEAHQSVDPISGDYSSDVVTEEAEGMILVEQEEDGTWSWEASIPSEYNFDLGGSGKSLISVEECYDQIKDWFDHFEEFEIIED